MKHYAPNILLSLKITWNVIALLYLLTKLGKGDNSAKYLQKFA